MKLYLLNHLEDRVMIALWKIKKGTIRELLVQLYSEDLSYQRLYNLLHRLNKVGLVKATTAGNHRFFRCAYRRNDFLRFYMNPVRKGYFKGSFQQLITYLKRWEIYKEDYVSLLKFSIISEKFKERFPDRKTTYYETDTTAGISKLIKKHSTSRIVIGKVKYPSRKMYGVLFQERV